MNNIEVCLVSLDQKIQDMVSSAAAAQNILVKIISAEELSLGEISADIYFLGADQISEIRNNKNLLDKRIFILGFDSDKLIEHSLAFTAPVILLPMSINKITEIMTEIRRKEAKTLAVFGGSGGVGASTLAASLAIRRAKQGYRVGLVDLDPIGGGIDLLLGLEREEGWRWSKFKTASGHIAEFYQQLPEISGVMVLSMSRNYCDIPREAVFSVLDSLNQSMDFLVLDIGRSWISELSAIAAFVDLKICVVSPEVRQVAAAKVSLAQLKDIKLVQRITGENAASELSEILGYPVITSYKGNPKLAKLAERGEPPALYPGSWAKICDQILVKLELGDR